MLHIRTSLSLLAITTGCCASLSFPRSVFRRIERTSLSANRWWESRPKDGSNESSTIITNQMEEEVMASARQTIDNNVVNRGLSFLIEDQRQTTDAPILSKRVDRNSLRDLAAGGTEVEGISNRRQSESDLFQSERGNNSWDTQQIALASGVTVLVLSPLVIPVIHSFIPPLIPFPSSVSFEGAALLGALSYIFALGDPTQQITTGMLSGRAAKAEADVLEIGGAASRIVGRTALQSVQSSAPRIKAAARALVNYDTTTATLEDLKTVKSQLSQTVLELESENDELRREMALWQAVEDTTSMYKLEELKELARYKGVKGFSVDSKNALLRKLIREGLVELDLSPYY